MTNLEFFNALLIIGLIVAFVAAYQTGKGSK